MIGLQECFYSLLKHCVIKWCGILRIKDKEKIETKTAILYSDTIAIE